MKEGYTERLQRVITRCCGLWSYRLAKENLQEFFGISLSHTTLGKIAGHTAEEMAARMQDNPDVRNDFQKANGRVEFYADGVFVHLRDEDGIARWHEMKVGALAKRLLGESALPSEWHTRKLPEPTVVSATCGDSGQRGISGTLPNDASLFGRWRGVFGIGGWGEMDLECGEGGVWQDGRVLGHLSWSGAHFGLWEDCFWRVWIEGMV
jgi:hypothetical protein